MILTANRYVNARVGGPFTSKFNSRHLNPGEKIDAKARILGEIIEGEDEWVITTENELFTLAGFEHSDSIKNLPIDALPDIVKKYEIDKIWDNFSKGEGIKIGIIDTTVYHHTALKVPILKLNKDVPDVEGINNHGTTMACIVTARDHENIKTGVSSLVSEIYAYTIPTASFQSKDLHEALSLMRKNGVHIINMSVSSNSEELSPTNQGGKKIQQLINEMKNEDIILVCSTGNSRKITPDFYPAAFANTISVAGLTPAFKLSRLSNIWNGVSISMASEEHYFTDSQYTNSNGTSSASAIITGVLACIYGALPKGNKINTILETFSKLPPTKRINVENISIPKFDSTLFIQHLKNKI